MPLNLPVTKVKMMKMDNLENMHSGKIYVSVLSGGFGKTGAMP